MVCAMVCAFLWGCMLPEGQDVASISKVAHRPLEYVQYSGEAAGRFGEKEILMAIWFGQMETAIYTLPGL